MRARDRWRRLTAAAGPLATTDDVRACYRLLLGREPDAGGLAHYTTRLARDRVALDDLVREFLASEEFAHRHPQLGRERAVERVETAEGFALYVDPRDWAVGGPIARTGRYEDDVTAVLRSQLAPGATFVDVGANVGWFTMLAATIVGATGRVVAVEPNPANTALIERSVAEAGVTGVTIAAGAAFDSTGLATLHVDASNGCVLALADVTTRAIECSYVVPVRRLDDILDDTGIERVDVMKVDVEGAELHVLRGAKATFERHRPVLVTEFFPEALRGAGGCEPADYLTALRDLGYDLSIIGADSSVPVTDEAILAAVASVDHVDLLATPQ